MMNEYRVPIEWHLYGYYYVEAKDANDAADICERLPIPENGSYLRHEIDQEGIEEWYVK